MNRPLFATCLAGTCLAGVIVGHALLKCPLRSGLGVLCGRGNLLAVAEDRGIYEEDVLRVQRETSYASGAALPRKPERSILPQLIANLSILRQARPESIPPAQIDYKYRILRSQLRDEPTWDAMLRANHFSPETLRAEIANNLRARAVMERRLAQITKITPRECHEYYEANTADYRLPARFRVRHLFFAAPPETPLEVVDAKKRAAEMTATRLAHGEDFAELAALASEDEATKKRGGDLSFFSEHRIPPDFIAAVADMRGGETSGIVHTGLGFHVIELLETRPSRQMGYDEAAEEIRLVLENEKRRWGCAEVAHELARGADFVHFPDHAD